MARPDYRFDLAGNLGDTATGAEKLTLTGHQRTVTDCDINADGTIIVSASKRSTLLRTWRVPQRAGAAMYKKSNPMNSRLPEER